MSNKEYNKTVILVVLGVVAFIFAVFGITYAYHVINIGGTPSSMTTTIKDLGTVTFADGNTININSLEPVTAAQRAAPTYYGRRAFTITAASTAYNVSYVVKLVTTENEFINRYSDEFTYTLTGNKTGSGSISIPYALRQMSPGASTLTIASGTLAAGNETHSYVFILGLNETESRQNYNQGKSYKGKIVVEYTETRYTNDGEIWTE